VLASVLDHARVHAAPVDREDALVLVSIQVELAVEDLGALPRQRPDGRLIAPRDRAFVLVFRQAQRLG
jgi:hypothetical protein